MSLTHLYGQLLAASAAPAVLEPAIQLRIFEYAQRHKRWDLLTQLARHPQLADDVDTRIRDIDELSVLIAWSTRPGRKAEDLAARLLAEKRVGALLSLAAQQDLPAEIYRTVAKVKSAKLAEALAANPSVPIDIRVEKLRMHVTKSPRGRYARHEQRIHEICVAEDDDDIRRLYETIIKHSLVAPFLVACFHKPYVRSADIDLVVAKLTAIDAYDDRAWRSSIADLARLIAVKATREQRTALLEKMAEILRSGANQSYRDWSISGIKAAYDELSVIDDSVVDTLRALEQSSTVEEFASRYEQARQLVRTGERHQLAQLVVGHPMAGTEQILTEVSHLRGGQDLKRAVRQFEKDERFDVIFALVDTWRDGGYVPTPLHYLANSTPVITAYVERKIAQGENLPNWVTQTDILAERPELALSSLRWERLCQTIGEHPQVAELVQRELIAELGDTAGRWEAINSIGDSFDGTFQDLLVVARELG